MVRYWCIHNLQGLFIVTAHHATNCAGATSGSARTLYRRRTVGRIGAVAAAGGGFPFGSPASPSVKGRGAGSAPQPLPPEGGLRACGASPFGVSQLLLVLPPFMVRCLGTASPYIRAAAQGSVI